jgi:cytidine deaminase
MNEPLGILTRFDELTPTEQEVVDLACFGADSSADHKLCFNSDFPVGAGILAANDLGETKLFAGANVENRWFPPTICAERTAATRAAFEGFKQFRIVSVFCRKHPGGSPCGLCRQVLAQFGRDSFLLNIVDRERTVRKALVGDLLPAAGGASVSFAQLSDDEKKLVKRVSAMKKRSHVPYSKRPRAALFVCENAKGRKRVFEGVSDDNASYGGSALADTVAMRTARTAGFHRNVSLIVTVDDTSAVNPVEGECLQVLREFGADAPILLVGPDHSVVRSSLKELLPDSFGPEAL